MVNEVGYLCLQRARGIGRRNDEFGQRSYGLLLLG
jgi:hypothetical protein